MMPRMSRRVDDVQKEFAEDFTVVNGNLLLCKVGYNSINLQIFSSVECTANIRPCPDIFVGIYVTKNI